MKEMAKNGSLGLNVKHKRNCWNTHSRHGISMALIKHLFKRWEINGVSVLYDPLTDQRAV